MQEAGSLQRKTYTENYEIGHVIPPRGVVEVASSTGGGVTEVLEHADVCKIGGRLIKFDTKAVTGKCSIFIIQWFAPPYGRRVVFLLR